jgi:hypothetical protein
MAISFGSPIDLTKLELQNARIQNLATAPSNPVEGQIYYDTADDTLKFYDGANWIDVATSDLVAGTGISITGGTISSSLVGGTDINITGGTINSEITNGTGILKSGGTLSADFGTITGKVAQGDDSRFSDSRTPTGAAGGALTGTYPNPGIAAGTITNTEISASAGIAVSKLAVDVLDRANHTGTQSATSISDLATTVKSYRLDEFAAPTNPVSAGSQRITNVAAGTASTDAVNLEQLQAAESGLDVKKSVKVATTANVTIATALNGGDSIDGVTLSNGDRVLVRAQDDPVQNGIYVAGDTPARSSDADSAGELSGGAFVFVEQGDTQADTGWVVTSNGSLTPGTDAIVWSIFSRAGELIAGDGLQKVSATLSVDSSVARRDAANAFTVASTFAAAAAGGTAVLEATGSSSGAGLRGVSDSGAGVEGSSTSGAAFKVPSSHGGTIAFDANAEGRIAGIVDGVNPQDAISKAQFDAKVATYKADIGNGTDTSIAVTHSLGTRDVQVEVIRNSGDYDTVLCEVKRTSTSAVTLVFGVAPTTDQYRVLITKVA